MVLTVVTKSDQKTYGLNRFFSSLYGKPVAGLSFLFSSDLDLAFDKLIDYYRLRFQIEFNFRDAKQFWGLEDFMNINQTPVYNSANLAIN